GELGPRRGGDPVRTAAIGQSDLEVRRFAEVAEDLVVAVVGEIAPLRRGEQVPGVAVEPLERQAGEDVSEGDDLRDRDPGASPAFFASQQVDDRKRLVRPREDVKM